MFSSEKRLVTRFGFATSSLLITNSEELTGAFIFDLGLTMP